MPGALASNFGELAKYDVGLFIQTEHGVHVYVLKGMQFVYERMVRAPQTLYLPNPILELDNLNTFIYFYNFFFFTTGKNCTCTETLLIPILPYGPEYHLPSVRWQ